MELKDLTREYLKRNHLNASILAAHIGVNVNTIWRWLKNDKGLSARNTAKVKAFLDGNWYVSAQQIINENTENTETEGENEDVKHYTNWRDYNYR